MLAPLYSLMETIVQLQTTSLVGLDSECHITWLLSLIYSFFSLCFIRVE